MAEFPVENVPVTIITGFLGVGKTTAILDLFRHRPPGERWAVLVNEFGQVGIDGAALAGVSGDDGDDGSGYAVREIAGGCICCTAGVKLKIGLVRLLREERPDRLLIEPTGLAHPATIVDLLRKPGIREAVVPRATIGLVDPQHFLLDKYQDNFTYQDQVALADVLIANRCDLASDEQIAAFRERADGLFPPKIVVATTQDGVLDPAWLDLDPRTKEFTRTSHVHHHAEHLELRQDAPPVGVPARLEDDDGEYATCGLIFPVEQAFDQHALERWVMGTAQPGALLPAGFMRLKGVFRVPGRWLMVNATPETLKFRPVNWRRDSRVEIIAAADPAPDWDTVEAALREAFWKPPTR